MHYLLKHKLLDFGMGVIFVLASLFVAVPQVSASVTCSPKTQSVAAYQQCVSTAPTGSTVYCADGSSVIVPATCTSAATANGSGCNEATGANCVKINTTSNTTKYWCGGDSTKVYTSINIGCKGVGNSITDMAFAIIRVLSNGVGLIIVGSTVWAGIQYTASRGDPNATAQAIKRIQSNVIALLIFIFGYAILNYVLPAGFLK